MGNVLEKAINKSPRSLTSTDRGDLEDLIRKYVEKREACMTSLLQLADYHPRWARTRKTTIAKIREVSVYLHKLEGDVNISNLTGSTAAILGGTMAIAGLVGVPLTGGLSLGLTVGGGALGTLGGLTASGSTLVKWGLTKSKNKEVIKALEKDYAVTEGLTEILTSLQKALEDLQEIAQKLDKLADRYGMLKFLIMEIYEGARMAGIDQIIASVVSPAAIPSSIGSSSQWMESLSGAAAFEDIAKNVGLTAASTIKVIGGALTAISISINAWNLISTSIDVHKGSKSQTAKLLEELAAKLEFEATKIQELVDNVQELKT